MNSYLRRLRGDSGLLSPVGRLAKCLHIRQASPGQRVSWRRPQQHHGVFRDYHSSSVDPISLLAECTVLLLTLLEVEGQQELREIED